MATSSSSSLELADLLSKDLFAWYSGNDDNPGSHAQCNFEREEELDLVLNAALQEFESSQTHSVAVPSKANPYSSRPFAAPVSEEDIQQAKQNAVPKSTQRDTQYCVRMWEGWCRSREQSVNCVIPPLCELNKSQLQHWMSRFVLKLRKKDGTEFPPNSLYHICCGLMRYLHSSGKPELDIFKDKEFAEFRTVLDSQMKRLQAAGIGSNKKKAEPITVKEEILWQKGLLGDSNPQTLVDTMLFMNGIYFALRGGKEHRDLRYEPCQIQLVEKPGERSYLKYTEDVSKNHPGGLKGLNVTPKEVIHHSNIGCPERCFVRLYKLYHSLCPPNRPKNAYYLQPLRNPKPGCWYAPTPVGHTEQIGTHADRNCGRTHAACCYGHLRPTS